MKKYFEVYYSELMTENLFINVKYVYRYISNNLQFFA